MVVITAITGSLLLLLLLWFAGWILSLRQPDKYASLAPPTLFSAEHRKENRLFFLIALLSAGVFCASVLLHPRDVTTTVLDLLFAGGMGLLAYIDLRFHTVPNRILLVLLALWAAVVSVSVILDPGRGVARLAMSVSGALFAGIIFLLCYLISGKQLGGGDVKLSFLMGLYLTNERVMGAIIYGVLLCCLVSIVGLLTKKLSAKDGIPLVPFLTFGTMLTLLLLS